MINLRILVPDDTINYITNPAFRYATTGWNLVGSTITRTLDYARFNVASLKVVTAGLVVNEGVYYRVSSLAGVNEPITASVYLRGDGSVRLRLLNNPTGVAAVKTAIVLRPERWIRVDVTGFATGSSDMRLYVETDDHAQAITFYLDGAQMERKSYPTTYCDGDQPGCRWNIVAHGSNSSRMGDTREGGRWVPLAGPCRPDNDIYVTVLGGLGMPPIANNIQSWSNSPGSFFQNEKIQDRVVTLSFGIKKESGRSGGTDLSLRALHEMRQQLIDLFKSDRTLDYQPFLFEYSDTDSDKPLYIQMRYDGGLEGSWDIRNKWYNTFPVRMIAVDPLFSEDTQDVLQLGIKNTAPVATNDAWARINGAWQPITDASGNAIGGTVRCFAMAPDGTLYIGGDFTTPAGITRVAKWDGATLTSMGAGGANGSVYGLDVGPDGSVYAVGNFTTIGGVACTRVAKYNPVANTWSAMGTGLGALGRTVCVAKNGQVYVGGSFTTAGGVTCYRIARWDGLQWRTVGALSGVSGDVYTIIRGVDGVTLYVGGDFLSDATGSVYYYNTASVNTSTNLLSQLGNGLLSIVKTMAVGLDGTLYAGGTFKATGPTPGVLTVNKVAKYTGGLSWQSMGTGIPNVVGVDSMTVGKQGEILIGGNLSTPISMFDSSVKKWFGGNLSSLEFPASSSAHEVFTVLVSPSGDLFVGGDISAPYEYPKLNTVTNSGSASCWPIMYIAGQGKLKYIGNIDTEQEIFLDLMVAYGEEVFIDFARGKIVSTVRGDLSYTIQPGSEIRAMNLIPGKNNIAILMDQEVTPVVQLQWVPQDWSADAVVDAPAL